MTWRGSGEPLRGAQSGGSKSVERATSAPLGGGRARLPWRWGWRRSRSATSRPHGLGAPTATGTATRSTGRTRTASAPRVPGAARRRRRARRRRGRSRRRSPLSGARRRGGLGGAGAGVAGPGMDWCRPRPSGRHPRIGRELATKCGARPGGLRPRPNPSSGDPAPRPGSPERLPRRREAGPDPRRVKSIMTQVADAVRRRSVPGFWIRRWELGFCVLVPCLVPRSVSARVAPWRMPVELFRPSLCPRVCGRALSGCPGTPWREGRKMKASVYVGHGVCLRSAVACVLPGRVSPFSDDGVRVS